MPRGSARGDLNRSANRCGLRQAPQGSDRPSSARENQEQRSEAKWKVRSPAKTCTKTRPEAPVQGQRDAHSKFPPANLPEHQRSHPTSSMKAPFLPASASRGDVDARLTHALMVCDPNQPAPRRRGRLIFGPRLNVRGRSPDTTFDDCTSHASDQKSVSAGGKKPRTTKRSEVETHSPVKTYTKTRPEAPVQGQRDAHSKLPPANLPEHQRRHQRSSNKAPFFASERVPRRRGRSSRSRVQMLHPASTSAVSPRGLLF